MDKIKITVVGLGHVGLANIAFLLKKYDVYGYDINQEKINALKSGHLYIDEPALKQALYSTQHKFYATNCAQDAFCNADYVIIATSTDFDETIPGFSTKSIETTLDSVKQYCEKAIVILRSTIPIGFTEQLSERYAGIKILHMPEFLREGSTFKDVQFPERVVVGLVNKKDTILAQCAIKLFPWEVGTLNTLIIESNASEAAKLFANAYLAMRVAFFNELDTFCELKKIKTKPVIDAICSDSRIGNYYNNPSFGYGGYCLPKDTKALQAQYQGVPQAIISSIDRSNMMRKKYLASNIKALIQLRNGSTGVVGIYRLSMKTNADNYRAAAVLDIIKELTQADISMVIYEPTCQSAYYCGVKVEGDISAFKEVSDIIIANRVDGFLSDVMEKVYTRDIFLNN